MAVTSGFFNSLNHDRMYDADQVSALFDGLIGDGIFQGIGNNLITRPGTGMRIVVGSGRSWYNHIWLYNDADLIFTLDEGGISGDRIDAIFIKIDKSETGRQGTIEVQKGVPGDGKPEFVDTEFIFYHPIAYVTVHAGASEITSADIEVLIGTEDAPFVSGVVQQYNIDQLMQKWSDSFEDWFQHLHDELDENQAAHLQNEIDEIVEAEFKKYYDLCTRNTTYTRNEVGNIVGWSSTGDGVDLTVTIVKDGSTKTYTYVIDDGTYTWTKTSVFDTDDDSLVETYTKGGV